ncbi:hypothetical protein AU255_02670 [Methyloprofundus sedimenti]|uniref:Pilus assembly protein PilE n=1 Tax=Methyloprofundus sedimenti TaxID=1420851 RepID=A0A1V8M5P5_9GAMM|nr:type IV pilin protein [Methyloprofundus sedimenti]OQK16826.1 hypothetical protein AU255_02670 [Methyloprofundus sedimenti]
MLFKKKYHTSGFTLIELMITVVVISILATIAIPSYLDSVRKARRNDAKGELSRLAQAQQKYRVINTGYATSALLAQFLDPTASPLPTSLPASTYYTFAVITNTAIAFTITATPKSTGGQNQDTCATLTIDQNALITSSASVACPTP